jgi:signal transduction histidine kinase
MTGLLDSTLDMVFQNRHDYQFMPSLFNIDSCLERVIKELEIIDGNSHKIEYINKIEEPTLYTDLRLTRLAVYNIIMNALKYSPKNSTVTIVAEENDGVVTISVKDEGDGIPESEQDMIFTPFYRGSQMGGLVPGTGLGLTVSKSCIEKLNGAITFDTEHGKGSCFYCTFPKRFVLRSK